MPIHRLRNAACVAAAVLLAACADVPTQSAEAGGAGPRTSTYTSVETDLGCCGSFEDVNSGGLLVGTRDVSNRSRGAAYTPAMGYRILRTLDSTFVLEPVARAFGVNDGGQIVGQSRDRYGIERPVLWQSMNAVPVDLGGLSPGGAGEALDVSASGWIVGRSEAAPGVYHAFVWIDGTMLNIGGAPSAAHAINDSLHVVGTALTASGQYRAFKWRYGFGRLPLASFGGPTAAFDINSRGHIVGVAANAQGADRAVLWTQAGIQDLGTLGGRFSVATGINDHGVVVGYSERANGTTSAFAWSPRTGMRAIDHTTYGTWAYAINRNGLVAGEVNGGQPLYWRITETNTRPSVAITTDVVTLNEGEPGLFAHPWTGQDGTQYFQYEWEDAEGDALTSEWSFGDGTSLSLPASKTEKTVPKTYRDQGVYTVRLIVKDPSAARDTVTAQVTILNLAPAGTFVLPVRTLYEGQTFQLNARAVVDGPADLAAGVQASFRCGGAWSAYVARGFAFTCPAPLDNGTLELGLRLRDKDGAVTEYTGSRTIQNAAPVASAAAVTSRTFAPGGSFTVSGGFGDLGAADGPWRYRYQWGDGTVTAGWATSPGSVPQASHVYPAAGSYPVSLWVTDKDNRTGKSADLVVTVGP